ncbi:MAG: ribonuclease III family protein [Erysipelotrichaceae bacterium]|nr:ribonuclease III family protein [Erysipelotrichaceae bacterium]
MIKKESFDWPVECLWPRPLENGEGDCWDYDEMLVLDEECEDLLKIREGYDDLVRNGVLDEDYHPIDEEYEAEDPDYWNDGFDIDLWQDDYNDAINHLKISSDKNDPVYAIRDAIDYEFVNENLLRQAFTRRSFALKHKVGDCEVLEFIGDMIIHSVITREMAKAFVRNDPSSTGCPLVFDKQEDALSKLRQHYECKEYLSRRLCELGLQRFILYGENEKESESSCEDALEALIGAVAIDSNWNWEVLEKVVDKLICLQLSKADTFLKETYYDLFNSWHQKKFNEMPSYEVHGYKDRFYCTLRYFVPNNDQNIETNQRVDVEAQSRSRAREKAALMAYDFVRSRGLWIDLKDAGIEPEFEDSINQLQELYQKKYIGMPEYRFEEDKGWRCDCLCNGVNGWGYADKKVAAKKKAAYMVLVRLYDSAGICKEEWKKKMWDLSTINLFASNEK